MATTTILGKTEKVIGLWLDAIGGDEPKWVVSRDRMAPTGEVETSDMVALFHEDDYGSARDRAIELARKDGLKVIRTEDGGDGEQSLVFDPANEGRS